MSNTRLRFWGEDQGQLNTLLDQIGKFVESNEPIAQVCLPPPFLPALFLSFLYPECTHYGPRSLSSVAFCLPLFPHRSARVRTHLHTRIDTRVCMYAHTHRRVRASIHSLTHAHAHAPTPTPTPTVPHDCSGPVRSGEQRPCVDRRCPLKLPGAGHAISMPLPPVQLRLRSFWSVCLGAQQGTASLLLANIISSSLGVELLLVAKTTELWHNVHPLYTSLIL